MSYTISTDPARLDVAAIHRFLSQDSYWAKNILLATVERALTHSLCFGAYAPDGALAGFCRVVTDRATFAWLCDVFVLPAYRGHGLGKQLVAAMLAHPDLQHLRRHLLATLDAHGLYEQQGYTPLRYPERWLERVHPNPYPAAE